jgi:hypothetical protein
VFHDEVMMTPRDEDHFWAMVEENFHSAVGTLKLRLQTREESLFEAKHEATPQSCIRYREASPDHDQREHYYSMGRSLLPRVATLIEKKELTPEFAQLWGVLMFSFGHTVNYQMDDSPVLEAARAGAAGGKLRSLIPQRRWLAHIVLPKAMARSSRSDADDYAVWLIKLVIARDGIGGFPPSWFKAMLSKKNENVLKTTFQQKNFSVREMEYACSLGNKGLPPVEENLLLSR